MDGRDIADAAVIDTVRQIEKLGEEQYDAYVKERLISQTKPISDPIKKNNLPLFSRPPVREKTKLQLQVTSLRNYCSLFSRLYIASQVRNGNLDEFFEHENQVYPPALTQNGKLRSGSKSDVVGCLKDVVTSQERTNNPDVQVIILDGSATVDMVRPGYTKTFFDYASQVFLPYIVSLAQHASRVDVDWDKYHPESLKAETRSKRGTGVRRGVAPSTAIPGKWKEFLRIDENKVELFFFLATTVVASIDCSKQIISTHRTEVLCNQSRDVSWLAPCSHIEADTRIILHLEDVVKEGNTNVSIRTVDTDVVVLAVTSAQCLNNAEGWIGFGTGKCFCLIAAHEIARALGQDRCMALPMFHAFTGCDTVSFLEEEVKELHETHGKPTMTLHQHFVLWRPPQSL